MFRTFHFLFLNFALLCIYFMLMILYATFLLTFECSYKKKNQCYLCCAKEKLSNVLRCKYSCVFF